MARRLLIAFGFPPALGGMQNYLYARCLTAKPDEITVLAPATEGDEAFDERQAFEVRRWFSRLDSVPGMGRLLQFILPLLYAVSLHRHNSFDMLECGQALPLGLIGWLFKRFSGTPYLVWSYGREILGPHRYPILRFLLQLIIEDADLIISVSEDTRRTLIELGASPHRVKVIYPSVDTQRFHPQVDGRSVIARHGLHDKRVILTVSRLFPRKGIDTVIQALPNVLNSVPEAVYLIVGDGPDRNRLEALARELNVADHVYFVGAVDDAILPHYYAACDVFAMVSRAIPEAGEVEGFGIVYLEAGASGKPVLAGRSGGVTEAVQDNVNGLLVDPLSVISVSDVLCDILTDPVLAARLGAGGRHRAQRRSRWELLETVKPVIVSQTV